MSKVSKTGLWFQSFSEKTTVLQKEMMQILVSKRCIFLYGNVWSQQSANMGNFNIIIRCM